MATKYISLTFLATVAAFIVFMNSPSRVSEPVGVAELSITESQPESQPASVQPAAPAGSLVAANVVNVPPAAAPVSVSQPTAPVQRSEAVKAPATAAVPETSAVVATIAEPKAEVPHSLVSEWLEVPNSLVAYIRSLPTPASAPVTKPPVAASKESHQEPTATNAQPINMDAARATADAKPAERSVSFVDAVLTPVAAVILGRTLLPLSSAPIAETPITYPEHQQTQAENSTESIRIPATAETAAVQPAARTASLIETVLSPIASLIFGRPLSPVTAVPVAAEAPAKHSSDQMAAIIEAPAVVTLKLVRAKPLDLRTTATTVTLAETTSVNISSTVRGRELLRMMPAPASQVPAAQVPATLATHSRLTVVKNFPYAIAERIPHAASPVGPAAKSFSFVDDTSPAASSIVVGRALLPTATAPSKTVPLPNKMAIVVRAEITLAAHQRFEPMAISAKYFANPAASEVAVINPAGRTLSFVDTAASQPSASVVRRALLSPVVLAPAAIPYVTVALHQSVASIGFAPRNFGAPAQVSVINPAARSFSTVDTNLSSISSTILRRAVSPLITAPAVVRQLAMPTDDRTIAAVPPIQMPVTAVQMLVPNSSAAHGSVPVLINSKTAYSPAMLTPLNMGPQPSSLLLAGMPTSAGGPSNEAAAPEPAIIPAAKPKSSSETLPVMITARSGFSLEMLKPLSAKPVIPTNPSAENDSYSTAAPDGSYCDPKFVGAPIRFSQTVELKLDDLLNQLNSRFGVNFIVGPEIGQLPLNIKAGSIPWNVLLRSQLYVSGVRATCIDSNTIELVLNNKVTELEKGQVQGEKLQSRYIKLKYLQPSSSSNKNVAGQSSTGGSSSGGQGNGQSGGCQQTSQGGSGQGGGSQSELPQRCKFERLLTEVRQILGLNDQAAVERIDTTAGGGSTVTLKAAEIGKRPYVGQVPGRNMLLVNATASQLREIEELIRHADIPPFQVVIKGLVYTANESKLKDIGVTASAILGTGNLHTLGGVTSLPGAVASSTPGTGTAPITGAGAIIPGGIRTLGPGFLQPTGNGDSIFGISSIIGTAQFSAQINALEQKGVLSLKSRPFATVLDGDTTELTVGREIPVIIQAANNLGGTPGTLEILHAANLLSVTPHVIDDDQGNPTAVNLELQLESNDADLSVVSQGVPSIQRRSIQSNFILNQEQTAVLGGFTVDSDSKSVTKTPGLGDVPILGELFKRRVRTSQINRLYFAISVTVIPYGGLIEPVRVPGATTDPPSLTPNLLRRSEAAEPKQVVPTPTPK